MVASPSSLYPHAENVHFTFGLQIDWFRLSGFGVRIKKFTIVPEVKL